MPETTPQLPAALDTDHDIVGSIVLYNTPRDEVDRAISQFFAIADADQLKLHLYIIDNSALASDNPLFADTRVTYHFSRRNLGYGRAHNIALHASKGRSRYNLIMNTDISYSPDVVLTLKAYLDSNAHAGLAAPKILHPDGTLQPVCRLLPLPLNIFLRRFFPDSKLAAKMDRDYELHWWNHGAIANIPFLSGSFLLARTEILGDLGGFDDRFFLYAEDVDLCRRIHQIAATAYVPAATITHAHRRLNRSSFRCTWHGLVSHIQYFNKWGWIFDANRRETNSRTIERLRAAAEDSLTPQLHT